MKKIVFLFVLTLIITACSGGGGDPVAAVEKYLEGKANSDAAVIGELLCSEMEGVREREVHTFSSVSGVHIEGMACEQVREGVVSCDGKIVATYGEEDTEFPLATYRVVEEDGQWKWCGETNP